MSDPLSLTALEARDAVRSGKLSAGELLRATLTQLERTEPEVSAYLTVTRKAALAEAAAVDARISRGEDPGPLAGVPVAIKDNMCTRGVQTTAASRILAGYEPPYDATVVARLRAAGAVILGKTNLDEFAMGSSTESSAYQKTRNPWDTSRVPGGSSGGSAAAVAVRSALCALGSDTGGSIRQPAALCGIVGIKPSYGLVSRYGLLAFASSLDQIGPFTRTVADAALLLETLAGHDPLDSTSLSAPAPAFLKDLQAMPKGLRVGIPKEHMAASMDDAVRAGVLQAAAALKAQGAELVDVALPMTDYGIATYYIVAPAEASSNLARYDGVHYGHRAKDAQGIVSLYARSRGEGFGSEVKRRIFLGTYVLSSGFYDAYYLKALKARRLIARDYEQAFAKCDVILGPTSPTTAFPLGERTADPLKMYAADVFTVTANLAGIPGISLPSGLSPEGLPIGVQLMAPHGADGLLLRVAHGLERAVGVLPPPKLATTPPEGPR